MGESPLERAYLSDNAGVDRGTFAFSGGDVDVFLFNSAILGVAE